ncbi:hypothetical protein HYW18_01345 [Candidatus Uhrbacteria bacterium]|nr:hypothetical protein [Candidatus Uhrbacteria bacterium]
MKRLFLAIEGNEAAGKSFLVDAVRAWAESQSKRALDLVAFGAKHHRLPLPEELDGFDILLSREPSPAWIGEAIRWEFVQRDARPYSGKEIAEAFALDRLVLYRRVLIPAFERGMVVCSDRSVASSIVYQPITEPDPLSLEEIISLPGNHLALEYGPTHLVVVLADPHEAAGRIAERTHKQDNARFEVLPFMQKLDERYRAPWFQTFWQSRGAHISLLDTSHTDTSQTQHEAQKIITSILSTSL